jgi:hypothetical protein
LIGDEDPFPGLLSVPEAEALVRDGQLRRRELEEQAEALQREIGPGAGDCSLALTGLAEMRVKAALVNVLDEDAGGALQALAARLRGGVVDLGVAAVFTHLSRANVLPARFKGEAHFAQRLRAMVSDHLRPLPAEDPPLVQVWQAALSRLEAGEVDTPLPLPGDAGG